MQRRRASRRCGQALLALAADAGAGGRRRVPADRPRVQRGRAWDGGDRHAARRGAGAAATSWSWLPAGARVRVRGVQVHGGRVARGRARSARGGQSARCRDAQVPRGAALAQPGTLRAVGVAQRRSCARWRVRRRCAPRPRCGCCSGPPNSTRGCACWTATCWSPATTGAGAAALRGAGGDPGAGARDPATAVAGADRGGRRDPGSRRPRGSGGMRRACCGGLRAWRRCRRREVLRQELALAGAEGRSLRACHG